MIAPRPAEEECDAEVRREDQARINQFARLNARLDEMRRDRATLQHDLEGLDDASTELMMLGGGDDGDDDDGDEPAAVVCYSRGKPLRRPRPTMRYSSANRKWKSCKPKPIAWFRKRNGFWRNKQSSKSYCTVDLENPSISRAVSVTQ